MCPNKFLCQALHKEPTLMTFIMWSWLLWIVCCVMSSITQKESFSDFLVKVLLSVLHWISAIMATASYHLAKLARWRWCVNVLTWPAMAIRFNRLLMFEVKVRVTFHKIAEKRNLLWNIFIYYLIIIYYNLNIIII